MQGGADFHGAGHEISEGPLPTPGSNPHLTMSARDSPMEGHLTRSGKILPRRTEIDLLAKIPSREERFHCISLLTKA